MTTLIKILRQMLFLHVLPSHKMNNVKITLKLMFLKGKWITFGNVIFSVTVQNVNNKEFTVYPCNMSWAFKFWLKHQYSTINDTSTGTTQADIFMLTEQKDYVTEENLNKLVKAIHSLLDCFWHLMFHCISVSYQTVSWYTVANPHDPFGYVECDFSIKV